MKILSGMIVIWYGSSGTIPAGYFRCDGENGTPDLKDRLLFCGDFIQPAGEVAGNWMHKHTGSTYIHHHTFAPGAEIGSGNDFDFDTDDANPVVVLTSGINIPPSMGLHYIQKA